MSIGLGEIQPNEWLDAFLEREGYEKKRRAYHIVDRCWCGSQNLFPLQDTTEVAKQYQRCALCGCLLLCNVLPSRDLSELYGFRYFREHQIAIGSPPFNGRYENDSTDRIPAWLAYLKKYCTNGRVIEVGSSHGRFVKELVTNGYHAVGLELDKEICDWARTRTGCDIRCMSMESVKGEQFDVVFANDVLEHVYDPAKFIGTTMKLLAPGGVAIFQTVVFDDLKKYPLRMMRPLYHTVLYNSASLERLEVAGCRFLANDPGVFGCRFVVFQKANPQSKCNTAFRRFCEKLKRN